MVNEHIDKVLSEGPSNWKELMGEDEEMLGPFLLCEPEEHKGFLRISRPERAGTFGSKDPHKQLPKELSAKVEHALFQWWHGCSTEHSSTAYLALVRLVTILKQLGDIRWHQRKCHQTTMIW
jgi:hypothetical protein